MDYTHQELEIGLKSFYERIRGSVTRLYLKQRSYIELFILSILSWKQTFILMLKMAIVLLPLDKKSLQRFFQKVRSSSYVDKTSFLVPSVLQMMSKLQVDNDL